MKIQPPQFLMAGIILLVFGLQCMLVDCYFLSEQASQILSSQLDIRPPILGEATAVPTDVNPSVGDAAIHQISPPVLTNRYTILLPEWLSWSLLSCAGLCFFWTLRTARRQT